MWRSLGLGKDSLRRASREDLFSVDSSYSWKALADERVRWLGAGQVRSGMQECSAQGQWKTTEIMTLEGFKVRRDCCHEGCDNVHSNRKGRDVRSTRWTFELSLFLFFQRKGSRWMVQTQERLDRFSMDTSQSAEPMDSRMDPLIKHLPCFFTFSFANKMIIFSGFIFGKELKLYLP